MDDTYRDYIPEGEDTGAFTKDGFSDWVPAPEPQPQVIEDTPVEEPVINPEPIVPPLEGGQE